MFRLPVNFFNDVQNISGYRRSAAIGVNRNQVDILIDLAHRSNVIEVEQIGSYCLNNLQTSVLGEQSVGRWVFP